MKQAYITALTSSLLATKDIEGVLKSTEALLKEKGHLRLWPSVLKGVVRALQKYEEDKTPQVTIASESSLDVVALKAALKELSLDTEVTRRTVDPTLIGGFIIQHQDKMLDKSYKRALVEIYHQVTK
jgi:F0F1-type ATP synthase delta subunit